MMRSLVLLALAAASASAWSAPRDTRPANGECEWRNPGAQKYMLPLSAALDRLNMIPADTRSKLKARLESNKVQTADDHILITSKGVTGTVGEYSLYDMNGGQGQVCWGEVTAKTWNPEHAERALVFCEDGHCIAYYSVCRNISRAILVKRNETPPAPMQRAQMPDMPADTTWEREQLDIQLDLIPVLALKEAPVEFSWRMAWEPLPQDRVRFAFPVPGLPVESVVAPVPEPSVYALMLLGLGLVGWMARRRKAESVRAVLSQPAQAGVRVTAHCVAGSQP